MEAAPWLGDGPDRFAPADSLLGMLQRGRGAGYFRALREPREVLRGLVLQCVAEGPLLYPDCTRAGYFAALARASGLPVCELGRIVREDDTAELLVRSRAPLARDMILDSALRGDPEAVGWLQGYVEWGHQWAAVIRALSWADRTDLFSQWSETILRRCRELSPERLWMALSGVRGLDAEPWTSWRLRDEHLDQALKGPTGGELGITQDELWEADPELEGMGFEELFVLVAGLKEEAIARRDFVFGQPLTAEQTARRLRSQRAANRLRRCRGAEHRDFLIGELSSASRQRCFLALLCLEGRDDPGVLPLLRSFVESTQETPHGMRDAALQVIGSISGDQVVSLAREWFDHPDEGMRRTARDVLQEHATIVDVPRLRAAIAEELLRSVRPKLVNLLVPFWRFPGLGRIAEIEQVYREGFDPVERICAAHAIHSIAPRYFSEEIAPECLWDCAAVLRTIACPEVDLGAPGVRRRLEELRDDPFEDDQVRAAAAARLGGASTDESPAVVA